MAHILLFAFAVYNILIGAIINANSNFLSQLVFKGIPITAGILIILGITTHNL